MKRLYKNLKQPKTWDIFKYSPIKDKSLAEKEYKLLLTQYDSKELLFIRLQTEINFQINSISFFENMLAVSYAFAIILILDSESLNIILTFITLTIICWFLARLHRQKQRLVDRILFVWMLRNYSDCQRITIEKNRLSIRVG